MSDPRPHRLSHLAEVIPLTRSAVADVPASRTTMARDVEMLHRRYGDRWPELPRQIGRRAAAAEHLLETGPTAIDPLTASPIDTAGAGWLVVRAALALAEQVVDDAEVVQEVLRADVLNLPLEELDRVVTAVLDLGLGGRVEPTWADPAAADAARAVLDAHSAQLRATNDLHVVLYDHFTDRILDIPEALLRAGSRPWRLISRAKLHAALASASRTGKVPGGRRAAAREVLDTLAARKILTTMTPLLTRHLGRTAFGPLTDVDALFESLSALRGLQRALGDGLDPDRLAGLLAADAFRSPVVAEPAASLRSTLLAWRADGASLCAGDSWAMTAEELASWAVHTAAVLPALTTGAQAAIELGRRPTSVRSLVNDLLLREDVGDLATRRDGGATESRPVRANDAGSAS